MLWGGIANFIYFGVSPRELDLAQSALLAGIIGSPSKYSPFVNMNLAFERQKKVLDLLLENGLINRRQYQKALSDSGRQEGICVLDPNTGYIKAMVGGKSFSENQFNRVTQAKRQMRSAFKPFYYTYALLKGYTSDPILLNYPIDFKGWKTTELR
ncbi:MAG: hypothetical protein DRP50_06775 [Thermotoga sp.]|nr:MAG: hypothetical protein DRP50_06775 [Thermotoga sp.]